MFFDCRCHQATEEDRAARCRVMGVMEASRGMATIATSNTTTMLAVATEGTTSGVPTPTSSSHQLMAKG